jgi:hypothetical protein
MTSKETNRVVMLDLPLQSFNRFDCHVIDTNGVQLEVQVKATFGFRQDNELTKDSPWWLGEKATGLRHKAERRNDAILLTIESS